MLNYKFCLYPTKEQESVLERTLDGCRWVYNYFLSIPPMSEYDINYALTAPKEQHSWLMNYHLKMLQMVGKQVATARKTATGKLSYRTYGDFNVFTYNQTGFRIEGNKLMLSKMGSIKILLHRQPINIKQVTVCRRNGKWYAVVGCNVLRRLHSTIIYNKRRDFLHKTSTYYCSRYDLIFLERLRVANMTRNHKLAHKILDAGWSTFKIMCKYKANRVVEVEPAYSSIDCSCRDHPVPKSLAIRTHSYPGCGTLLDRDYNSAINHLRN